MQGTQRSIYRQSSDTFSDIRQTDNTYFIMCCMVTLQLESLPPSHPVNDWFLDLVLLLAERNKRSKK